MAIKITKGINDRDIILGDIVKLGRCLILNINNATKQNIEYVVGVVCEIPDTEEYINIRLEKNGTVLQFFRQDIKPRIHSSFKGVKNNDWLYQIDVETNIYWSCHI